MNAKQRRAAALMETKMRLAEKWERKLMASGLCKTKQKQKRCTRARNILTKVKKYRQEAENVRRAAGLEMTAVEEVELERLYRKHKGDEFPETK